MKLTEKQLRQIIREAIELDIEKGDVILTGKFKNKRTVVKDIGTDDLGQPTINGRSILKFRIEKHLPKEKWSSKSRKEAGLEEARQFIREVAGQDTVEIAGRDIKLASKEAIVRSIKAARRSNAGRSYADTHALWAAEPGETPEQTVERLRKWASGNFPGGVTLYQDPETGEVFGHAKYNTF